MNRACYALAKGTVRLVFGAVWRYGTSGVQNVPKTGPLIVAANHISYFDPPALAIGLPRPVTYMAKEELFDIPLLGTLISMLGAFPVDRKRGDVTAMKAALGLLRTGACVGIFPEGTRNKEGTIEPQLGTALLAALSGAAVVPAYVSGTAAAKRLAKMTVAYGAPLRFEAGRKASREDLAKWTGDLMKRIYALRENTGGH